MNHNSTGLFGRIAQYATALLGIVFFIMIYAGNDTGVDGGLWVSYIAMGLSMAIVLVFAVTGMNKKSIIGIGGFLLLFAISYAMADGSVKPEWGITEQASKLIGAGLIMLTIAMVGAVGAILVGEVSRMLK